VAVRMERAEAYSNLLANPVPLACISFAVANRRSHPIYTLDGYGLIGGFTADLPAHRAILKWTLPLSKGGVAGPCHGPGAKLIEIPAQGGMEFRRCEALPIYRDSKGRPHYFDLDAFDTLLVQVGWGNDPLHTAPRERPCTCTAECRITVAPH